LGLAAHKSRATLEGVGSNWAVPGPLGRRSAAGIGPAAAVSTAGAAPAADMAAGTEVVTGPAAVAGKHLAPFEAHTADAGREYSANSEPVLTV
jgi:hypothetical protein